MTEKIRRYDLDWLRVLVFGLLIFYHVGMFFVPWGWHIKNNVIYDWLQWPMLFVNQWRLSILFVISGMGTCFALSFRNGRQFAWERMKRLWLPLAFGMVVIVPPQVYIERLVSGAFSGNYGAFYTTVAFSGIYPAGNFSWHHLWFLPYLLIYSLLLIPVFLYLRSNAQARLLQWLRKSLRRPLGLYVLIIPLYFTEALLEPFFPVTHGLVGDWFAFFNYMILFFYGFLLIRIQDAFWKALTQIKTKALAIGIFSFILLSLIWQLEDNIYVHFTEALVKVVNTWSWILVLFAYAAQFLNRKSALLSYCNTAVYPFYILHQTVTVILGFYLMDSSMGFLSKFLIMVLGTFVISWLLYEFVIRRIGWLRPLFGLKGRPLPKQSMDTLPSAFAQ